MGQILRQLFKVSMHNLSWHIGPAKTGLVVSYEIMKQETVFTATFKSNLFKDKKQFNRMRIDSILEGGMEGWHRKAE